MARPSSGVWFKWQYDKSQMQAIKEAGFESVRIFMPYAAKLEETQEQIEDALEAGLSIVVCMWGLNDWASNVAKGEREIANGGSNGEGWGPLALAWKVCAPPRPLTAQPVACSYTYFKSFATSPKHSKSDEPTPTAAGLLQSARLRGAE